MFEWLASNDGQELSHAVIVLLLAVASYLSWRTHQRVKDGDAKRHRHRDQTEDQ
jgi:hypothetical protein